MSQLELDKWTLKSFFEIWKKGRVILQPDYQRGKVWDDQRRYNLVDTIRRQWPSGLIMLKAYKQNDTPGALEAYDVVDGQQRLTTLFNYLDGHGDADGSGEWLKKYRINYAPALNYIKNYCRMTKQELMNTRYPSYFCANMK
jgi:uncharacterized protein with ParB-like and HNH nuclease domain